MALRRRTIGALLAAVCAVLIPASPALAATPKYVLSPASTVVSASLSSGTDFQAYFGGVTVNCSTASFSGLTPRAGLIIPLPSTGDSLTGCSDTLEGTEIATLQGTWKLAFLGPKKAKLVIPQGGATIASSLGCTNTWSPTGTTSLSGTYVAATGTFAVTSQYVSDASSCTTTISEVAINVSLVLSPAVKVVAG